MESLDEAEKEFREAIRINPNDVKAHNNLGLLLMKQGKYKEARAKLEKAVELFEKQGDAKSAKDIRELIEKLPK